MLTTEAIWHQFAFIHLSIILQYIRMALQKKESYQNSVVGKNGSINLELVKSLFISENEKIWEKLGWWGDEAGRGESEREGKKGERSGGGYTPVKQQRES